SMGVQSDLGTAETGVGQSVTFDDVAGVDEARAELAETIEFLRDPEKFGRLGGRSPRGILLSGPPGTGKTLLARAAASEAGVPFLSVSGSSFQEKFAGLGAARLRRLFARAGANRYSESTRASSRSKTASTSPGLRAARPASPAQTSRTS